MNNYREELQPLTDLCVVLQGLQLLYQLGLLGGVLRQLVVAVPQLLQLLPAHKSL